MPPVLSPPPQFLQTAVRLQTYAVVMDALCWWTPSIETITDTVECQRGGAREEDKAQARKQLELHRDKFFPSLGAQARAGVCSTSSSAAGCLARAAAYLQTWLAQGIWGWMGGINGSRQRRRKGSVQISPFARTRSDAPMRKVFAIVLVVLSVVEVATVKGGWLGRASSWLHAAYCNWRSFDWAHEAARCISHPNPQRRLLIRRPVSFGGSLRGGETTISCLLSFLSFSPACSMRIHESADPRIHESTTAPRRCRCPCRAAFSGSASGGLLSQSITRWRWQLGVLADGCRSDVMASWNRRGSWPSVRIDIPAWPHR
ncbi:hypothetical protein BZA05DRAFT_384962 [Tricharina praecox]|uniref:uncharacterized protein n=1 Tax=Tricharina praecox TaxID=43433 RepID=UPI002220B321|nr:uncharacterized protein BZA05DRAFT_384962 [Tricharina praecox]KAI5857826.1 hypothetical protein BZA05DRAFT_384962 [Tricharina praecox]